MNLLKTILAALDFDDTLDGFGCRQHSIQKVWRKPSGLFTWRSGCRNEQS